jgi:hypothetical protein
VPFARQIAARVTHLSGKAAKAFKVHPQIEYEFDGSRTIPESLEAVFVDEVGNDHVIYLKEGEWAHFEDFCLWGNLQPLPARPETVALYLAKMSDQGLKPATMSRRLGAQQDALRARIQLAHCHESSLHQRSLARDAPAQGNAPECEGRGDDRRPEVAPRGGTKLGAGECAIAPS